MKSIPDKIYLQVGDDDPFDKNGDFKDLSQVSWCQDKIYESDIEYVVVSKAFDPPISRCVDADAPYEDMSEEFMKGFNFCLDMVKYFEGKVSVSAEKAHTQFQPITDEEIEAEAWKSLGYAFPQDYNDLGSLFKGEFDQFVKAAKWMRDKLSANQDLYEEIERLKKQVQELSANQITPKQRTFLDLNTPLGGY